MLNVVGTEVGDGDGGKVGCEEGKGVGTSVGFGNGFREGTAEGASVG